MTASDGFLGVPYRQLSALLRPLMPAERSESAGEDRDALRTRFARAVLTTMCEPGDNDAGALVAALGPARTLSSIVCGENPQQVLLHLGADAVSTRMHNRMANALERWRTHGSTEAGVRALETAGHMRARLITPEDPSWPDGLSSLGLGEPIALWLRGDPHRLGALSRSIALVGARAATGYGEHVAMESAAALGDRGFAIVSGGAYGIDGASHRAALASGHTTIAVLAGGVDRLYPAGHSDLLRRIADTGLLIGELPCGSTPTRWRFLMRNRLIAAASGATVVIEAGHRSGSLNTAGHAAEMGRTLGAVPGPVTSPASAGCHRLIREYAATCVTTPDEMAELADPVGGRCELSRAADSPHLTADTSSTADTGLTTDQRILAATFTSAARDSTDLAHATGLTIAEITAGLGRLELAGALRLTASGWRSTE